MHRTVGARFTVALGTVFHRTTCEVVAFDRTSEPFATGNADSVNQITGCENVSRNLVADFIFRSFSKTEFPYEFDRSDTSLVEEPASIM